MDILENICTECARPPPLTVCTRKGWDVFFVAEHTEVNNWNGNVRGAHSKTEDERS